MIYSDFTRIVSESNVFCKKGTDTALAELQKTDRKANLNRNIKRGNHKSTRKSKEHENFLIFFLQKKLKKVG